MIYFHCPSLTYFCIEKQAYCIQCSTSGWKTYINMFPLCVLSDLPDVHASIMFDPNQRSLLVHKTSIHFLSGQDFALAHC